MNKNREISILLYIIGIALVIVALVQYSQRSSILLHESTGVIKALFWLIGACAAFVIGYLISKKDSEQNNKDKTNELNQKDNE